MSEQDAPDVPQAPPAEEALREMAEAAADYLYVGEDEEEWKAARSRLVRAVAAQNDREQAARGKPAPIPVPPDVLRQAIEAMDEVQAQAILDRIDLGDEWGCTPTRLNGLRMLSAALSELRRLETKEGK